MHQDKYSSTDDLNIYLGSRLSKYSPTVLHSNGEMSLLSDKQIRGWYGLNNYSAIFEHLWYGNNTPLAFGSPGRNQDNDLSVCEQPLASMVCVPLQGASRILGYGHRSKKVTLGPNESVTTCLQICKGLDYQVIFEHSINWQKMCAKFDGVKCTRMTISFY